MTDHIKNLQHERLVHLLVTLAVGLGALISFCFAALAKNTSLYVVTALLLLLFVPYIFHYYKLENTLQKLYKTKRK